MRRAKRRVFSGAVCEQIVYPVPDGTRNIKDSEPKPRFENEQERKEHRIGISRRRHAQSFNANFSPTSLYSTLTFDDENEVHTFKDARRIRDNYVRALQRKYPDAVIFIYMGRGKNTNRIHYHMVTEGIPEESITKKWKYGSVIRVSKLRAHNKYDGVDHGQDYTGLADYLFNHWTEEVGGHRWKQTRNARKPEREDATEAKLDYSEKKPPRAPKGYTLVECKTTKYGYLYFKYVKLPPKRKPGRPREGGEGTT